MTVSSEQEEVMRVHCGHARYVWNLAWELTRYGELETYGDASRQTRDDGTTFIRQKRRPVRKRPGLVAQCRMLAEARAEFGWLGEGSSTVQQAALRDFDRAWSAFLDPQNPAGHPRVRRKRGTQGFVIRDANTRRISRKWGEVLVPKAGWVRFRWSRDLPAGHGQARVTLDGAGRWHVAFQSPQQPVPRIPAGRQAGIDRGVCQALVTSDGQHYRAPRISDRDAERYLALQRQYARQARGSRRREDTRLKMARITAKVTDRRRDWAEKVSTRLVADYDLIVFEQLNVPGMTRRPGPKPDPERAGAFLPNRARAKAGLNKAILASAWGVLARRAEEKAQASGCRVVYVDARFTSQQCRACGHAEAGNRESQAVFACRKCGHHDHADRNAARNVLARGLAAVAAGPAHRPGHGRRSRKPAHAAARTTRASA